MANITKEMKREARQLLIGITPEQAKEQRPDLSEAIDIVMGEKSGGSGTRLPANFRTSRGVDF